MPRRSSRLGLWLEGPNSGWQLAGQQHATALFPSHDEVPKRHMISPPDRPGYAP